MSQLHDREKQVGPLTTQSDDMVGGTDSGKSSLTEPTADLAESGSRKQLERQENTGTWRSNTFAALAVKPYRNLWYGGVFSFLAVQMQVIARGALAWDLTESNSALGIVMFGFGLPMLLLTPVAGVVADRFSKRSVILLSQWLLVISALLVAAALVFDVMAFWMLVASSAVQAASFAFLGPARMAFTGELVGRDRLSNAVILQQMSMNGTRVIGPASAGMLLGVSWFGYSGVYFLTAALTFLASTLTFTLPPGLPPADKETKRPLEEFTDGLKYVRQNPNLLLLLIISLAVIMVAFPYISFLPTLAKDVYDEGDSGYGFMSGATAIGAVSASLFIASRSNGPGVWRLQAAAGLAFGLGLILLAVVPTFHVTLLVLVLVGGSTSAFQALNNTMVLMGSEMSYHGRMQSLMMLTFSGFGLMALPIGIIADAIGLRQTFAGMGAITSIIMVIYFIIRPGIDRRYPPPTVLN